MGMLMHRHRREQIKRERAEAEAPKRRRGRRTKAEREAAEAAAAEQAEQERVEREGAYADLTDEQVQEAYATKVDADGEYPGRDAAVEAMQALDAEQDESEQD